MQRAINLILVQCRETTMTYHCTKYRLLTTSKNTCYGRFCLNKSLQNCTLICSAHKSRIQGATALKIEYDVGNRWKFIVVVFKKLKSTCEMLF